MFDNMRISAIGRQRSQLGHDTDYSEHFVMRTQLSGRRESKQHLSRMRQRNAFNRPLVYLPKRRRKIG